MVQKNLKKSTSSSDYKVGKGRTPLHTRWKPGQSGNPVGRKKGELNYKTIVEMIEDELLDRYVMVTDRSGERKITKYQATIMTVVNDALKGDKKSTRDVIELAWQAAKHSRGAALGLGGLEEDIALCQRISAELEADEDDE